MGQSHPVFCQPCLAGSSFPHHLSGGIIHPGIRSRDHGVHMCMGCADHRRTDAAAGDPAQDRHDPCGCDLCDPGACTRGDVRDLWEFLQFCRYEFRRRRCPFFQLGLYRHESSSDRHTGAVAVTDDPGVLFCPKEDKDRDNEMDPPSDPSASGGRSAVCHPSGA